MLELGGDDAVYVPGHGGCVDAAFVRAQRAWLTGSCSATSRWSAPVELVDEPVPADSRVMHIGGFIFSTFWRSPVGLHDHPSSRIRSRSRRSTTAGSSVTRSRTSSTPMYGPLPCTVPIGGWRVASLVDPRDDVVADGDGVLRRRLVLDGVENGQPDHAG